MSQSVLALTPTTVAAGGDAIARDDDGRVVFVEGALPGEQVRAVVVEERRDFARARVVEVVEAGAGRVAAACSGVAAGCGGCQWQHVDADWQRRLKRDVVVDALRRLGRVEAAEAVVGKRVDAVPADGYRTTLRLAVDGEGRAVYRRRHGHEVVAVEECPVADARLAELVVEGRFGRAAREVVLRVSAATGERVALVRPRVGADVAVPPDVLVVGDDERRRGRGPSAAVTEVVAGRPWRVSVSSFFQSGPAAAELVVAAVRAAAGVGEVGGGDGGGAGAGGGGARLAAGDVVVDAYAGVGVLGGALAADSGARVVAVEQHRSAVRDARRNLADLDAVVVAEEVAAWDASSVAPAAVVVADPSRSGLGSSAVRALAAADAPVFVLVSCDPASMARDVVLLRAAGYRLESVQVLDLFPHTFHVETVARLCR